MPSKSSGRKIVKLKLNKKTVTLTFDDRKKLSFNREVMANFYLYEGKTIDDKTLKKIKEFDSSITLFNYAMSLIKKGHISEWKMREKLYNKEGTKPIVDKIIKSLKNNDLINDKMLILDTIEYGNERNIGKNKIIQELSQKGIFMENLSGINFPSSLEKKKAMNNLPKLEKRYDKYSYEQKKQHIYRALLSLGFENDIALSVVNNVKLPNQKEENKKLEKDFEKVYVRYHKKYLGYELKNKVVSSLKTKGYKTKDILNIWEKNYGENGF